MTEDVLVSYIIVRPNLSPGKTAAQCAHAGQQLQILFQEYKDYYVTKEKYTPDMYLYEDWIKNGVRKIVLQSTSEEEFEYFRKEADVEIIDAGFTEVEAGTCTVVVFWPNYKSKLKDKFGHLKSYKELIYLE